jgi:hypothetical protein
MFVRIKGEDMVPGNKYKIDGFTGYLIEWDQVYYVFEKSNLRNYKGQTIHCSPKNHTFYEFVSQNPQWKMERRAVNRILRRLIGDDCFEW